MPISTPIYDFLTRYHDREGLRLHMPGHKGKPLFTGALGEAAALDLTEIEGSDSLYEASGVIAESERRTAALFGASATAYSAGGSTLCIQAMLAMIAAQGGGTIIAARNVHRAFVSAAALLDLTVVWIYPDYAEGTLLSGEVSPVSVQAALRAHPEARAVYLTSPDYLGVMTDIAAVSEVCRAAAVPLLVDAAHGSHLRFLETDRHALTEGADLCCNSAHKTLPAFTGAAYLHAGDTPFGRTFALRMKAAMSMFGSTSPSYLILASLDLCQAYLREQGAADIRTIAERADVLRDALRSQGWLVEEAEPLRVTVNGISRGQTGTSVAAALRKLGIECEYADSVHLVALLSPAMEEAELRRFAAAMAAIPQGEGEVLLPACAPLRLSAHTSLREAVFRSSETLPVEACVGRVCAGVHVTCPPGVPLVVPGECITPEAINILKSYSISSLNVLK